jgi:hypothetical protein
MRCGRRILHADYLAMHLSLIDTRAVASIQNTLAARIHRLLSIPDYVLIPQTSDRAEH